MSKLDVPATYEWSFAFQLLAVRRCLGLWQDLGVPALLIAKSDAALDASRQFLRDLRTLAVERGLTETVGPAIGSALDRLEVQLRQDYDPGTVREVFEWGERYFIRDRPTWTRWALVLTGLNARPVAMLKDQIRPSSHVWLLDALASRFGERAREELRRRSAEARNVALSGVEVDLLSIDAGSRGPDDPEVFDVVRSAEVVVSSHRAYTFWLEAHQRLLSDEIDRLLAAARDRADRAIHIGALRDPLT